MRPADEERPLCFTPTANRNAPLPLKSKDVCGLFSHDILGAFPPHDDKKTPKGAYDSPATSALASLSACLFRMLGRLELILLSPSRSAGRNKGGEGNNNVTRQ